MEHSQSFIPLLIVAALAVVVPLALSRFPRLSLPVVVGEILAGIVVGDSGLGLVAPDPMLAILSLLGFAYLMFLSGLEVDFDVLLPRVGAWSGSWRQRLSQPLSLGILIFVITLGLGGLAGLALRALSAARDPWLMALILSTTSLGLVMPVLKERGLMNRPYGQSLLVAAVIADFATMLLVSIYVILHTQGITPELLLILLLFGVFGAVYRVARAAHRRFPGSNVLENLSHATAQIDVRAALAIALAFIALAQGLGVEMILGAFLGGALISLLADRGATDLHHRLDVIGYGFFVPIFFIMVGVRFDLASLFRSSRTLLLVPLLLILAYGIKLVAALLFKLKHSWRDTLAAGILLSSRLSLIIAVSAIGLELGRINEATNSAIVLVAIITSTLSPLLFNRIGPTVPAARHRFVIVGHGQLARLLAKRIEGHGKEVISLDGGGSAQAGSHAGALDLPAWGRLEPDTIQAVATLLPSDQENLEVARLARERLGIAHVAALVHEPAQAAHFRKMGVQVINPTLSPVVEMEYLLLYPTVSSLLSDLDDEYDISEVRLSCADLVGRPLRDMALPQGLSIVLVRRDEEVILPRGNTTLRSGDVLTFMGPLEVVRAFAQRCE